MNKGKKANNAVEKETKKAKKQKRIVENDTTLLERLRTIRNKTGLDQEGFYFKYVEPLHIRNISAGSSAQGFMRDLENGKTPLTPALLVMYANIAECSIDALVTGKEYDAGSRRKRLTARDVCRMIVAIDEGYHFNHAEKETKLNSNDEALIEEYYGGISNGIPVSIRFNKMVGLSLPPHFHEYSTVIVDEKNNYIDSMHEGITTSYFEINRFLQRYYQLKAMPDLPPDMFKILYDKYLSDVPDDPAPYPENVIVDK